MLSPASSCRQPFVAPAMAPRFILRSAAETQRRYDSTRWVRNAGYSSRKSSLERQGLLAWTKVVWMDELLAVTIHPVAGEVDLALWRPWQLHVSIAFKGELAEEEVEQLRGLVHKRLFRIRFHRFGSGGSGELAPTTPLYRLARPFQQRGYYAKRPLHMSF